MAETIWRAESKADADLSIILTDENHLLELNRLYKNERYDTDILSFPLSEPHAKLFEGEIYVSMDRVRENAGLFSVSPTLELRRVVAHGILHFLGYDDATPTQTATMTEKENFYVAL